MDPKVYDLIGQAVAEGFTLHTLLIAGTTVVIGLISGYLVAFIKRKGENLATKQDFEFLKDQLAANTRLTETIKQDLSKEYSLWQAHFDFKRKQIEEFYSPLLFLVRRKNWIQKQQDDRMQLSLEIHGGQNPEWADILRSFSDDYILPLRAEIAEYFKTRSFLMEEEPESFSQFLRHDAESRPLYTLWNRRGIDGIIKAVDWPEELEADIRRTKERLERELRDLLKLPAISRSADMAAHVAVSAVVPTPPRTKAGELHRPALSRKSRSASRL